MTVAALYVDKAGPYMAMDDVDAWTIDRDARLYEGPSSVVAHPPCADWSRLSCMPGVKANAARNPGRRECGPRAVEQVRARRGVLEHPAYSKLWHEMDMPRPHSAGILGRSLADEWGGWSIDVEQVSWGHRARKRTWLYIVGLAPRDVDPRSGGTPTHVVTTSRARGSSLPELTRHRERHLTPPAFAAFLVDIARRAS